ncbi:MAG: hypothetical protein ACE5ES_03890 [Candidatus Nanoarchaeia archaeon]
MAVEDLVFAIPQELVGKVGVLVTVLQALGGIIIFYIIFSIINTIINKRRNKKLEEAVDVIYEIRDILANQRKSVNRRR